MNNKNELINLLKDNISDVIMHLLFAAKIKLCNYY
jgi:hypothetical protein